jgi:hypothetical protein
MMPSSEDRLARSYFDEPLWPLGHVLAWIRFRSIELLTVNYEDIRSLHFQARMYKTSPWPSPLVTESPAVDLHKRLKAGKIEAIRPNGEKVSAVFWHKGSSNPRTWPEVWFRQDDVLREWPQRGTGGEAPTAEVATAAPAVPPVGGKRTRADRVAQEIKRRYPDGPLMGNKQFAKEMNCSVRTLNRALSILGWSWR